LDGLKPGRRARGAESFANYLLLVAIEIEVPAWMNGERREAAPMPGPKAEHNWNSRRILRRQSHEKLIATDLSGERHDVGGVPWKLGG